MIIKLESKFFEIILCYKICSFYYIRFRCSYCFFYKLSNFVIFGIIDDSYYCNVIL